MLRAAPLRTAAAVGRGPAAAAAVPRLCAPAGSLQPISPSCLSCCAASRPATPAPITAIFLGAAIVRALAEGRATGEG